jgi:hypothetical protein
MQEISRRRVSVTIRVLFYSVWHLKEEDEEKVQFMHAVLL